MIKCYVVIFVNAECVSPVPLVTFEEGEKEEKIGAPKNAPG